jgi:[FeFe] hydrogenase H-cluster maturation GTPase HydF
MSLNSTPSSSRTHIGIFGKRNAGKSSLINAITGQDLSVVSDVSGTTTDPVQKAMELLPIGPVVIIDTPGLDDVGELGALRVQKSRQVLRRTDIAVLVADASSGLSDTDADLLRDIRSRNVPFVLAFNKSDLRQNADTSSVAAFLAEHKLDSSLAEHSILVSAKTGYHIRELKELIAAQKQTEGKEKRLVGDLIPKGSVSVLVVPIDSSAPKGRLILPQQQAIRDILDADAMSIVCKDTDLAATLKALSSPPAMVITDSQAFRQVANVTPDSIPLTSFSILMARFKGDLPTLVKGVTALKKLRDGDRVLISEGCTHHRQCEDIGTVRLPAIIRKFTGINPEFSWTSGTGFPEDLSAYRLIVHCGGCMLNEREMKYRIAHAAEQGIPVTNYGVTIAYANGILKRSLSVFPELAKLVD